MLDVDAAWEAPWVEQGGGDFSPTEAEAGLVGFQIRSELWALEWASTYRRDGLYPNVMPRPTEKFSLDKFLTGGRVAGIVFGEFSLSSYRVSLGGGLVDFGGQSRIVGPDSEILGLASSERPVCDG